MNKLHQAWRSASNVYRAPPSAAPQINAIFLEVIPEIPVKNVAENKEVLSKRVTAACAYGQHKSVCFTSVDDRGTIVGFLIVDECDSFIIHHANEPLFHLELSYSGVTSTHRNQKRFQRMLENVIACAPEIPIRAVVKHDNLAGMASILAKNKFEIVPDAGLLQNETTYFLNLPAELKQ